MFTGIIESTSQIIKIEKDQSNVHFTLKNDLAPELKIDQSVSHNGVCLTVVNVTGQFIHVTAITGNIK